MRTASYIKQKPHVLAGTIAIVAMLLVMCLLTVKARAFSYEPIDVSVPITTNEKMTIVIKDLTDPTNTITVGVEGRKALSFHIDEPGDYTYEVYQDLTAEQLKDEKKTWDATRWHLLVSVQDKDEVLKPVVVITDLGTMTKPDSLSFENKEIEEPEPETTTPETPTTPTNPETPTTPSGGGTPSTPSGGGTPMSNATTGDTNNMWLWIILGGVAVICIIASIVVIRKTKKPEYK